MLSKVEKLINNFKASVYISGPFYVILFLFLSCLSYGQKAQKIEILNANTFEYEEIHGLKIRKLIGDVKLKHEDALMYCDSAYTYPSSNTMDAFSNVRIEQGDSLKIFGDSLKYNGNTKKAILRGNIQLVNKDVTLTTSFLDYDRNSNIAYYYSGGTMVNQNENNTLTSDQGYYYTDIESFYFKKDVVLTNPDYKIEADTLNYNSASEIVNFLGPTTITSDNNFIYTEDGWYNTNTNKSKFFKNAYLYSDNKLIEGDTLYYDREIGYGEIICNAVITDTIENLILQGDIAHLFEQKDSAMVTEEAMMVQRMDKDTLYMHADTFIVSTSYLKRNVVLGKEDTLINIDSTLMDTVRNMFAYNRVKFYKNDMQGKADSLVYNFSDSTINFYNDPILWSQENQITAVFIYLIMSNNKVDKMYMNEDAFIISKADSLRNNYNQIKGDSMMGTFKEQALHRINVKHNSETIYYPIDDDGKYIGVNKISGENMLIFLEDNEIETISFIKSPEGVLNPIQDLSPKDRLLKGFNWRVNDRPKNMFDIFVW